MSKSEFRNKFAEDIFYLKYAQGNNDSWHNLAIRLVDDVCGTQDGKLHPLLSTTERNYLVELIRTFKFIPGGRYLYYAGRSAHFRMVFAYSESYVSTHVRWWYWY